MPRGLSESGNDYDSTKSVKSEALVKDVEELVFAKGKFMAMRERTRVHALEENHSGPRRHKGFLFETTRPACRGRQVWPVLAEILPVFGLIGAVVGLGFAYLSVFVVRATPLG